MAFNPFTQYHLKYAMRQRPALTVNGVKVMREYLFQSLLTFESCLFLILNLLQLGSCFCPTTWFISIMGLSRWFPKTGNMDRDINTDRPRKTRPVLLEVRSSKWFICFVVSFAVFVVSFSSTLLYSALGLICLWLTRHRISSFMEWWVFYVPLVLQLLSGSLLFMTIDCPCYSHCTRRESGIANWKPWVSCSSFLLQLACVLR